VAFSLKFIARVVLVVFIVFLALALIDYLIERWRFERSIKMTRYELKEEMKEHEGDPLVKSRIKSIQRELARKRMMQEVPKATVVITNPAHLAVALMYRKNETPAPKVIAKGAGLVADKIKEIARKHSIPIVEDKPLAQALYKLEIGSTIPEELYRAVARILAYLYRIGRIV
jgi:flagellar biosynthetic protein FlhB